MMRKFLALVNPHAGNDFPIIEKLREFSNHFKVEIETDILTERPNENNPFQKRNLQQYDALIGYGGDGTISQIATSLIQKQAPPLIILPGGTANVLAKELNIPLDIDKALQLLLLKELNPTPIDAYYLNNQPGILRINAGILASMITETTEQLKKTFGSVAYTLTAASQVPTAPLIDFHLTTDGVFQTFQAIGMMIANSGNIGIEGFNLHPRINLSDGKLDVITIFNQNFTTITELLAMIINQTETPNIQHTSASKIKLEFKQPQTLIFDDQPITGANFEIQVAPQSISLIIPPHEPTL